MGFYSQNRITGLGYYSSEEIVADESYQGEIGAAIALIEAAENDRAMFNAVIMNDFAEAALLKEGAEDELMSLQEANLSGIIDRVKEFIKKCWAKIKGIIQSVLTRLGTLITRDNKKLVEKYKKQVVGKDLTKMKYKWCANKNGSEGGLNKLHLDGVTSSVNDAIDACIHKDMSFVENLKSNSEKEGYSDGLLNSVTGVSGITMSNASKEFHDYYFGESEEVTGLKDGDISMMMKWLTDSSTSLKTVKDTGSKIDQFFSKALRSVDGARNQVFKSVPGKDDDNGGDFDINGKKEHYGKNDTAMVTRLNLAYSLVSKAQTVQTKLVSLCTTEIKFMIAQCRRVFVQAASFNPKSVKEDAELFAGLADASDFELID